ncbi:hypothetical protein [Leucobacter chromiireducens]|nr:hypothetical protein [Leucobacter chromiireducens]
MTTRRAGVIGATAAAAAVLLLAGCASGSPAGEDTNSGGDGGETSTAGPSDTAPTTAELERLIADGVLPADFPAAAERVRLIQDGDELAASWTGAALSEGCSAADSSPGSIASMLLLQDVGITEVQQCGAVWQATQADGSHVLWNTER